MKILEIFGAKLGDTGLPNMNADLVLQSAFRYVYVLIGIVSVIALIYAGITMMRAQGEPGRIKQGKNAVKYSIVGLIVALIMGVVVEFLLRNV